MSQWFHPDWVHPRPITGQALGRYDRVWVVRGQLISLLQFVQRQPEDVPTDIGREAMLLTVRLKVQIKPIERQKITSCFDNFDSCVAAFNRVRFEAGN